MKVLNYLDCERTEKKPGQFHRTLIDRRDGALSFRLYVWEIEPGVTQLSQPHPGEHAALILSGKGLFRSGDKEIPIAKDSVVFTGPNEDHNWVNTGNEPLRWLFVHTNYGEE